MRNLILNHYIWRLPDPSVKFAMRTIWLAYKNKTPAPTSNAAILESNGVYPPNSPEPPLTDEEELEFENLFTQQHQQHEQQLDMQQKLLEFALRVQQPPPPQAHPQDEPTARKPWNGKITDDDIYPTDRMDIDPVLHVTDPSFTSTLKSSTDPATRLAGEYLFNIRNYYDIWMDNNMDINIKITKLEAFVSYLSTFYIAKSEIYEHSRDSVKSLKALNEILKKNSTVLSATSHLSTLVTENYFSQVCLGCCIDDGCS